METTVTEALQELKTIQKRIQSKRDGILQYTTRSGDKVDPLQKEAGGSKGWIDRERQAIRDLQTRFVRLRTAILLSNLQTELELHGDKRTIAEWLVWRREQQRDEGQFLQGIGQSIGRARNRSYVGEDKEPDVVVNVDEGQLREDAEKFVQLSSDLDGKLSLLNATTTIEVE